MNSNQCPHCDQTVASTASDWEKSFWRMHHLLDHALMSVAEMTLDHLPDMNYADFVDEQPVTEENAWDVAAECARRCLTDEMFPILVDVRLSTEALEESAALGQCKPYPSNYANNWSKGMYVWLHERYPQVIQPWNDEIEQLSMAGSEEPIFRVERSF